MANPKQIERFVKAAANGDIATVRELLAAGVPVDTPSKYAHEKTALACAASYGHRAIVELLVGAGANVNHRTVKRSVGDHGETPIFEAVCADLETTRFLLDHGADLSVRLDNGDDALTSMLDYGVGSSSIFDPDPEVARLLIARGIDPLRRWGRAESGSRATPPEHTALALAAARGKDGVPIVELLLDLLPPNERFPYLALSFRHVYRDSEVLPFLVRAWLDPDAKGWTPSRSDCAGIDVLSEILALANKDGELVRELLERVANAPRQAGETPLAKARQIGRVVFDTIVRERRARHLSTRPTTDALRAARQAAEAAPGDAAVRRAYGEELLRHGKRAAAWHELNAAGAGRAMTDELAAAFTLQNPPGTFWRFVPFEPRGLAPEVADGWVPGIRVRAGNRELPLNIVLGRPCTVCDENCEVVCRNCNGDGWTYDQWDHKEDCPPRATCYDCHGTKFRFKIQPAGRGTCTHPAHADEMRTDRGLLKRCTTCGLAEFVPTRNYWTTDACAECGLFDCVCPGKDEEHSRVSKKSRKTAKARAVPATPRSPAQTIPSKESEKDEKHSHVSYGVPEPEGETAPAEREQKSRVKRKDCHTCVAIERAGVGEGRRGSLTEHMEAGREKSRHLPPEIRKLVTIGGDDRRGEMQRCPECGTLYCYQQRYEYSSNSESDDDQTLWRVEDAVAALVTPLLEPLAPGVFDAKLAAALRSRNREVRHAAMGILHGAGEKEPLDAALAAAAEAGAAAEKSRDYEIWYGCGEALASYRKSREAGEARTVRAAPQSRVQAKPSEQSGKDEKRDGGISFDPKDPELGRKVAEALQGGDLGRKIALLTFLVDNDLAPALQGFHPEPVYMFEVVSQYMDDPQAVGLLEGVCAYELAKYPDDQMTAAQGKVLLQSLTDMIKGNRKDPVEAERDWQLGRKHQPEAHAERENALRLFRLITKSPETAGATPPGQPRELLRTLWEHSAGVDVVAFSPDGKAFASVSGREIGLWDAATGNVIRIHDGHEVWIHALAFSPDGKTLASGSFDKTVKLWDVASGKNLATLSGNKDAVDSVAFSPHGEILASGTGDGKITLWGVATGKVIRVLGRDGVPGRPRSSHHGAVSSISFSPDGKVLASGSIDAKVKLWDVAGGEEIRPLAEHGKRVHSVSFSPDGKILASASDDGTIKFRDVAGQEIGVCSGHRSEVRSVAFSPDGMTLASGSSDRDIKLWHVPSGEEIKTLSGHGSDVNSLSFSPDGRLLASGSRDYSIRIWDVKIDLELAAKKRGKAPSGAPRKGDAPFDPKDPALGEKIVKAFEASQAAGAGDLGRKIALLTFLVENDLAPVFPGAETYHEHEQMGRVIRQYFDDPQATGLLEVACAYEVAKYSGRFGVARWGENLITNITINIAIVRSRTPAQAEEHWRASRELRPEAIPERENAHRLFSLIERKTANAPIAPAATLIKAWTFESSMSLDDMNKALDERSSSPWQTGDSPRPGRYIGHLVPPDATARIYSTEKGYVVQLESIRTDHRGLFDLAQLRLLTEILPLTQAENVLACDPLGPE